MSEPRCDLDLAQESVDADCGGEIGTQHLDGDPTVVFEVAAERGVLIESGCAENCRRFLEVEI